MSFTRTLALEGADDNIYVNSIAPGLINTPMTQRTLVKRIPLEQLTSRIPLGRMADPDEIARPAVFFASDDSSFVTGVTLSVDGGALLR